MSSETNTFARNNRVEHLKPAKCGKSDKLSAQVAVRSEGSSPGFVNRSHHKQGRDRRNLTWLELSLNHISTICDALGTKVPWAPCWKNDDALRHHGPFQWCEKRWRSAWRADIRFNLEAILIAIATVFPVNLKRDIPAAVRRDASVRLAFSRLVSYLKRSYHRGYHGAAKEFADVARRKAVQDNRLRLNTSVYKVSNVPSHLTKMRGSPEGLFTASTIARAVVLKATKLPNSHVQEKAAAALKRITTDHKGDSTELLLDVVETTMRSMAGKPLTTYGVPIPTASACYEQSRQVGGARDIFLRGRTRYEGLIQAFLFSHNMPLSLLWNVKTSQQAGIVLHGHSGREWSSPKVWEGLLRDAGIIYDLNGFADLGSYHRSCLHDQTKRGMAVLCPIAEANGKVRVATLHDMSSGHSARLLTDTLRALRGRLAPIRAPGGKPLSLQRERPRCNVDGCSRFRGDVGTAKEDKQCIECKDATLRVYSIDFAASTDPISLDQARVTTTLLLQKLFRTDIIPAELLRAMDLVYREHDLHDKRDGPKVGVSKCGAMMGLGPGWYVMCVMNVGAALVAGIPIKAMINQGDDLICLATESEYERFVDIVTKLSLDLNHDKTFRSETRGVFCESFFERKVLFGKHFLVEKACPKISFLATSKAVLAGTPIRSCIVNLRKSAFFTKQAVALETVRLKVRKHRARFNTPGLIEQGGNGQGEANLTSVFLMLTQKPLSLTKSNIPIENRGAVVLLKDQLALAATHALVVKATNSGRVNWGKDQPESEPGVSLNAALASVTVGATMNPWCEGHGYKPPTALSGNMQRKLTAIHDAKRRKAERTFSGLTPRERRDVLCKLINSKPAPIPRSGKKGGNNLVVATSILRMPLSRTCRNFCRGALLRLPPWKICAQIAKDALGWTVPPIILEKMLLTNFQKSRYLFVRADTHGNLTHGVDPTLNDRPEIFGMSPHES